MEGELESIKSYLGYDQPGTNPLSLGKPRRLQSGFPTGKEAQTREQSLMLDLKTAPPKLLL
jgi:hypothetical protein